MAWLGLGLIAAAIGKGSAELAQATTVGVRLAWSAGNQPDREFRDALIDRGATELAQAVGILVRLILEGIVLYLTRGLPASTTRTFLQTARETGVSAGQAVPRAAVAKVVAELRASKLGPQFAEWVERNWEQLLKNPKLNKPPRPVAVEPPPRTGPPAVTPSQLRKLRQDDLSKGAGAKTDSFVVDREGVPIGAIKGDAKPGLPRQALSKEGWPDLPAREAPNFNNAEAVTLPPGTKIYRVIDDSSNPSGGYWLERLPNDRASWRAESAVKNDWNTNGKYVEYEVPEGAGLKLWRGSAAAQKLIGSEYTLPGGGAQLWTPPGSVNPSMPKPTGW